MGLRPSASRETIMEATSNCDVLLLGDYSFDIIITGLGEVPRLGAETYGQSMEIAPGGGYNVAAALHRLGVKVRWAARVGTDLFSRYLMEQVEREGLDTSLFTFAAEPFRSITVAFSFSHDRGFVSYLDPNPPGERNYELVASQKPHWVFNAPFDGSAESRRFARFVHANGGRIYADCQYTQRTLAEPGLAEMLAAVDIFAPNQSEACQLTGAPDAYSAAEILAQHCPLVVVKCGVEGALARSGAQVWRAPSIPVEVVDTTGAGDCFNAGFLYAYLKGEPIETCLRCGNICGGLSVTQCGGASAAPSLEQLISYL